MGALGITLSIAPGEVGCRGVLFLLFSMGTECHNGE